MNIYIDKENLHSLLISKHERKNDVLHLIKKQLNNFFNFTKRDIGTFYEIQEYLRSFGDGARETREIQWDISFPQDLYLK